jgi:hypothetical protein
MEQFVLEFICVAGIRRFVLYLVVRAGSRVQGVDQRRKASNVVPILHSYVVSDVQHFPALIVLFACVFVCFGKDPGDVKRGNTLFSTYVLWTSRSK